jgi:hypothetical protein
LAIKAFFLMPCLGKRDTGIQEGKSIFFAPEL